MSDKLEKKAVEKLKIVTKKAIVSKEVEGAAKAALVQGASRSTVTKTIKSASKRALLRVVKSAKKAADNE